LIRAANVASDGPHRGTNFASHQVQRFLFAAADDYARAFARKKFGDGASYAAAGTGNDGNFSV
jgi:hypothetical protein